MSIDRAGRLLPGPSSVMMNRETSQRRTGEPSMSSERSKDMGWPLALIVLGLLLMGVGFLTYRLKRMAER